MFLLIYFIVKLYKIQDILNPYENAFGTFIFK